MITFLELKHSEDTIRDLTQKISDDIHDILTQQAECSLALAGGNTPKPLYQNLSRQMLPWHQVNATLTDERWLEPSNASSNQNMIWHNLIQNQAEEVNFVPLKNPYATPELGKAECEAILNQIIPSLDLVILGMGDDGHFASIFPNMENTQSLLDVTKHQKCEAANPENKEPRISLSLSYLLTAKHIYLLISGAEKKAIIDTILKEETVLEQYPISTLLMQTNTPVTIYWSL